jgi:hypothetical protein
VTNDQTRPHQLYALLGAPGSGKTSLIDVIIATADAKGREVIIIDPAKQWPGRGVWPERGTRGDDTRSPEERAEEVITSVRVKRRRQGADPRPGLLILDDCDVYLGGGHPRGVWRDLFATFRHWRLDVVVSARRTQDVPKLVFTSASHVALFRHREVHAKDYLRQYLGDPIVDALPTEPYRYLWVDVDQQTFVSMSTKKRSSERK